MNIAEPINSYFKVTIKNKSYQLASAGISCLKRISYNSMYFLQSKIKILFRKGFGIDDKGFIAFVIYFFIIPEQEAQVIL